MVKPYSLTKMSQLTEPEKKILDAAKRVFEKVGYSGARMQQIADEAGISKASLHYYFRSKENLFDRIFEETISSFLPIISTWDEESEDWEDKLRSFITEIFTFLKNNSLLFIIGEINRDPNLMLTRKKEAKHKKNRFIAYFERLQKKGAITSINIKLIYVFMHSLCSYPLINSTIFKMNMNMTDKEFDVFMEEYPDYVADFLIAGIKRQKSKS